MTKATSTWINEFLQDYEKADGAIKVLGAFYCRNGDKSAAKLLAKTKKTVDTVLNRLRNFDSPHKMTLLYYCIPSLMSYTIRTHKPETSKEAAEYFDGEIEKLWAEFAEIIPDDVNRKLAALPVKEGGCGLTRCFPLRQIAYDASLRAANGEPGESQHAGTERYNRAIIDELDQDKMLKQHRDDVKVDLNAAWYTQSKDSDIKMISHAQSSALLRMRLASPHRSLVTDEKQMVYCKGCKAKIHRRAWYQHARGCTKIPGQNGSQAHAIGKKLMGDLVTSLGLHIEAKEPDFTIVKCPSCRKFVDVFGTDWARNHCGGVCIQAELEAARRMRPDNRVHTRKGPAVTDLSLTGCIDPKCAALSQAAQRRLKARAKVKDDNYKDRVEAAGETFYPIISTCNGTLGEAACEFLKLLYDNRNKENELLTFRQLTSNFKRIIHSISAGALINAERVHGVTHIKQVARDDADLPWHEAFIATTTTTSSATTAVSSDTATGEACRPTTSTKNIRQPSTGRVIDTAAAGASA